MSKKRLTTRADRAEAKAERERGDGPLVPVNVVAVQDLLRGQPLATVSRLTQLPRRTLDHLRNGRVKRTRYRFLRRLARHFGRAPEALTGQPDTLRPAASSGEFAAQARADMTLRKLAGAGVTETDNLRLLTLLERLHDLSTFRSILGAQGLPIFKLGDESGWRPLRKNQQKVERLRERFADLIHELFAVLVAASSKEAGKGIQLTRLETALEAVAQSADAPAPKDDELRKLVEAALAEDAETAVARTPRGPQKAQRPRRRSKAAD